MELLSLLVLLLICFCHQVESNPDVVSKLRNGSTLYNNQPISVTCTTTGSQVLIWESDEYIGQGRHVIVSLSDSPGTTIPLPDSEVTILVKRTSNTPGEEMIESLLTVTALATYPNFTITCRTNDLGTTESVIYHTTNKTAVNLTSGVDRCVCPEDTAHFDCTALDTDLIKWYTYISFAGNDTVHVTLYCQKDGALSPNETVGGISLFLEEYDRDSTDADGTPILSCGLHMNLPFDSVDNLSIFIGCYNHDVSIWDNTTFSNCTSTTTNPVNLVVPTTTPNSNETGSWSCPLFTSTMVYIVFILPTIICVGNII